MQKGYIKIKSCIILTMTVLSFLLCTGCPHNESILFIYKNYSYEILESNPKVKENIKKECRDNGYIPQFVVITKKGEESIMDIINQTKASVVYLDPLIRELPGTIARQYVDTLYFTLKRNLGRVKPMNLLTIDFDRGKTYNQAGIITGNLLLNGLLEKSDTENGKQKKAGMIVYPVSPEVQKESSEYMNGFFSVNSEDFFVYREVNNIDDKAHLKNIMDEMSNDGVILFFLRVYFVNTFCLDYLKKEGGYAIVENWNSASGYEDTVLFTIEDDFPGSLSELFQNIRVREDGSCEWKKKEIKGKVTVVRGTAIEFQE